MSALANIFLSLKNERLDKSAEDMKRGLEGKKKDGNMLSWNQSCIFYRHINM